jgi:hypothetical protein
MQALQHPGDLLVFVAPALSGCRLDIAEVDAILRPHLHLVGRSGGDPQKAPELTAAPVLLAEPLGDVGADRLRRPPDLLGEPELFDPGGTAG